MATLSNKNGLKTIQFVDSGRATRTIRLGRISKPQANTIRSHIAELNNSKIMNQSPPTETARWLAGVGGKLRDDLVKFGMAEPRVAAISNRLGDYFDDYVAKRTDLKPNSLRNIKQAKNSLVEYFKADREIQSINRAEVKDWHRDGMNKHSEATMATHVKKARQVFADALDRKLIPENPFMAVKIGAMDNPDRMFYVAPAVIEKVIDSCPDEEWKLLFAAARYQGLRIPSESDAFQWPHVDWERMRITIHSSKTERHKGKDTRVMPIMPEFLPYLQRAFDLAGEGATHIFTRRRGEGMGAKADARIIKAGEHPWEKTFQNLRSSCETDLLRKGHQLHVVCKWLGNSATVAARHYLQVIEADFEAATTSASKGAADNLGQHQTKTGQQSNNTNEINESEGNGNSPWGYLNHLDFREIQQNKETALRKALQVLGKSQSKAVEDLILRMSGRSRRSALSAAKGGQL